MGTSKHHKEGEKRCKLIIDLYEKYAFIFNGTKGKHQLQSRRKNGPSSSHVGYL